jgi:hypothetical protein
MFKIGANTAMDLKTFGTSNSGISGVKSGILKRQWIYYIIQ